MAKKYNAAETAERNRRDTYFRDVVIHFLAYARDLSINDKYSYFFEDDIHGKIIIYPKGDLLLFTKINKWKGDAVCWLRENIIKEKF